MQFLKKQVLLLKCPIVNDEREEQYNERIEVVYPTPLYVWSACRYAQYQFILLAKEQGRMESISSVHTTCLTYGRHYVKRPHTQSIITF